MGQDQCKECSTCPGETFGTKLDLRNSRNPVYEQFLNSFKLTLDVQQIERPVSTVNNLFDDVNSDTENNTVRAILDNPHAPKGPKVRYVMDMPDYTNVDVERAKKKLG